MSCCRKSIRSSATKDFCSSITMATAVTFRTGATGVEATITTPTGQRLAIPEALAQHGCSGQQSAGIKLAEVVNRALLRVMQMKPDAIAGLLNRQMPLLMAKEKLFALVDRCGSCGGLGCVNCGSTGFKV